MPTMIQEANAYIAGHRDLVNPRYRMGYHAQPPIGWINDPNGFCYFRGLYHLFCQYNPYKAEWGLMHWGHWTSPDLLHWEWRGVALAPDQPYDCGGCFSGTALVTGNQLTLMYTGISHAPDGSERQQQCIAQSDDGLRFEKLAGNPVIPSTVLPAGADPRDFRDPKLLAADGGYRAVIASRGKDGGQLPVYRSVDLREWTMEGFLIQGWGGMLECPDYVTVDSHNVLIACVIKPERKSRAYAAVRQESTALAPFPVHGAGEIDYGPEFYAPQTVTAPDGTCVMTAWMNTWGMCLPAQELQHDWCGWMCMPRVLSVRGGKLLQRPLPALRTLRGSGETYAGFLGSGTVLSGPHEEMAEFAVKLKPETSARTTLGLFASGDECLQITYDAATARLCVDRSRLRRTIKSPQPAGLFPAAPAILHNGELALQIMIDVCSVEIFINDGEAVLSLPVFPAEGPYGFRITAKGTCATEATVWPLNP